MTKLFALAGRYALMAAALSVAVTLSADEKDQADAARGKSKPDGESARKIDQRKQEKAAAKAKLLKEADEAAVARNAKGEGDRISAAKLRHLETGKRLRAALLDEGAPPKALLTAADDLRRDKNLPAKDRLEIAELAELVTRKKAKFASKDEWTRSREASVRKIVGEFQSEVPEVHGLLVRFAGSVDRARAIAIAQQVVDSDAPEAVKNAARQLIAQRTLIGKELDVALAGVFGAGPLLRTLADNPVVFYTWHPADRRSIDQARLVGESAPPNAVVIGVNLSPDIVTALRLVDLENLPGEQLYGGRGFDSPVAKALHLQVPSAVLIVGSKDRRIIDLSGNADLAKALAALN